VELAEFVYGDTATVRVINRGLRRRANPNDVGFWLDPTTGRWVSEKRASDLALEDVRLAAPVSEEAAVSVRYALERGIEAVFQLEDAELTSQALPDDSGRGRMLFIESAEGGAGILRRLHDEADALAKVAEEVLRIIHVDPRTGDDVGRAPGARERCERGCYDCLLSYSNQPDHTRIDRLAAAGILRALASSATSPSYQHRGGTDGHERELADRAGSDLERSVVRFLRTGGYRLPDSTQVLVHPARARPDFVYRLPSGDVAVFVDGPHHNEPEVAMRDERAEKRLSDVGWLVVRFRYDNDWEQVVAKFPSVFGPGWRA
jgi:hypothetical protein